MADVLVRLIDLVYELLNRDVVLRSVGQTFVERFLQLGILVLCILQQLLHAALLLLKTGDACILGCQILLRSLKALCERLVLSLAVHQILLAGATGHQ